MNRTLLLGSLAIVVIGCFLAPPTGNWSDDQRAVAWGLGFGSAIAFLYVLLTGIRGHVVVQNAPRQPGDEERWISGSAAFNALKWYDWLVVGVAVFGGFLIGSAAV
jgi:hypothetical protein